MSLRAQALWLKVDLPPHPALPRVVSWWKETRTSSQEPWATEPCTAGGSGEEGQGNASGPCQPLPLAGRDWVPGSPLPVLPGSHLSPWVSSKFTYFYILSFSSLSHCSLPPREVKRWRKREKKQVWWQCCGGHTLSQLLLAGGWGGGPRSSRQVSRS